MTCREKLKINHPDAISKNAPGGCVGCPYDYGYAGKPYYCTPPVTCEECWDREVEERESEMKKEFTKADLQTGMVVKLRNNEYCFVIKRGEELRIFTENEFLDGKNILDNLKSNMFEGKTRYSLDIMQVFAPAMLEKVTGISCLNEEKGELLWERREKMTLEEIEKELGYKIEIVAPPVGKDS